MSEGLNVIDTYVEHGSAWKDTDRPKYQEIREHVTTEDIDAIIMWAFDQWIRNYKQLQEDIRFLESHDVELHTVKEDGLNQLNQDGVIGRAFRDAMITLLGAIAERESKRKSERIRAAYQNHEGNWGREGIRDKIRQDVLELQREGHSQRDIADTVNYYDENRNPKHPSLSTVRRILKDAQDEDD
jgi:DNA invertase Pin-like site-specific DNA recombinase